MNMKEEALAIVRFVMRSFTRIKMWQCWEAEIREHALEIRLVEVSYVPEHCLISPVAGRHIHGVDYLLEIIVYDLHEGAALSVLF